MADSPFFVTDISATDPTTSTINVGDLRHAYGFNVKDISRLDKVNKPVFRLLSVLRKKPVTESTFKIPEERPFTYKRYAYPVAWRTWSGSGTVPTADYSATSDITSATPETADSYIAFKMGCDYKSDGNITNIFGQSNNAIAIGATGTAPIFFLKRQNVKINTKATATGIAPADYLIITVLDVQVSGNYAYVGGVVTRPITTSTNSHLCSFTAASTPISNTYTYIHSEQAGGTLATLASMKADVMGNTYGEFTGMPGYYNTQPFTTRWGQLQLTKHAFGVSGEMLATEFKFEKDEMARRWREVLKEHTDVISQDSYFSSLTTETATGVKHTQGMVDFALLYGAKFTLDLTSGSGTNQDDLLEQMTVMIDPNHGTGSGVQGKLFAVPMRTWNWLHKLGGYAFNNMNTGLVSGSTTPAFAYKVDFAQLGPARLADVDIFQFGTAHGKMNVVYDPTLDGTNVAMIGIPMKGVNYCVLEGNGISRDTTYYPKVLDIANGGIDGRVDLIQTQWGIMETLPEEWVIWTFA